MVQAKRPLMSRPVMQPRDLLPPLSQVSRSRSHTVQLSILVVLIILTILMYVLIVALEGLYQS
jgi:uncharacterized integral membrane protein